MELKDILAGLPVFEAALKAMFPGAREIEISFNDHSGSYESGPDILEERDVGGYGGLPDINNWASVEDRDKAIAENKVMKIFFQAKDQELEYKDFPSAWRCGSSLVTIFNKFAKGAGIECPSDEWLTAFEDLFHRTLSKEEGHEYAHWYLGWYDESWQYKTVGEFIRHEDREEENDWINDEEQSMAHATFQYWRFQCYARTPVGFWWQHSHSLTTLTNLAYTQECDPEPEE